MRAIKKRKRILGRIPLPSKPPKIETPATVYNRRREKALSRKDADSAHEDRE